MANMNALLKMTMDRGASDLHLVSNHPPIIRIDGRLIPAEDSILTDQDVRKLIYSILDKEKEAIFEKEKELDFSFTLPDMDRFRVNVHYQKGNVEAALRRIPWTVPDFRELGIPSIAYDFIRKPSGLVLVTGATGMGKSTTLASMIDVINQEREEMIISVEDPIEFVHANKKSVVKQREVHSDTKSFPEALRRVLRQDPDVIVVGEMRDLETISTTLTAAETGHLVFATLHTPDAPQTIDRIIDVFPPYQQKQIRVQLADSLRGIISQLLLPKAGGQGRVLATEVLVATPAIRNLIRENETAQLSSMIQMGGQYGMHTMDKCLKELVQRGLITKEDALLRVNNLNEFDAL